MSSSTKGPQPNASTTKSRSRKRDFLNQLFQKKTGPSRNASPSPSQGHGASPERPAISDKLKDGAGIVLSGMETSLKMLKECSDWNPILKSAVAGIVACIDLVGVRGFQ